MSESDIMIAIKAIKAIMLQFFSEQGWLKLLLTRPTRFNFYFRTWLIKLLTIQSN